MTEEKSKTSANADSDATANDPTEPALRFYDGLVNKYAAEVSTAEGIVKRFGAIRGLSFLAAFVFLVVGMTSVITPWIAFTLGGISLFGFFVVTFYHENADRRLEVLRARRRTNEQSAARLKRDWETADEPRVEFDDRYSAIAKDLDLFGKATLFQLICIAKTTTGRNRLAEWFLDSPSIAEITDRQQAVRQCAPQTELREDLQVFGNIIRSSKSGPESLIEWSESGSWFTGRQWLKVLAIGLATLMLLTIFLLITGIIPRPVSATAMMFLLAVNFIVTTFSSGSIHWVFRQVSSRSSAIESYAKLFELSRKIDGDAEMVKAIRAELSEGESNARSEMRRLSHIMGFANMRAAGILFLVYLFVQFFFVWDIHILAWLEKWKQRNRDHVRRWFDAIGDWEALASLSQVAHDHPHWVWPQFLHTDQPAELTAESIGHPLLNEQTRVSNSVRLGPPGRVLLVTGSNMSGKSTLLRSIGINITLAQAGSVVCAGRMSLPLVTIETSMRISDSLAGGVSFFMAELKRLKEIVDEAKTFAPDSPRVLLYLLDEILQGTNSTERHIAVQRVLQHLLESRAIGAISTHDLDLANAEGIRDRMLPVHFRETFTDGPQGKSMSFDYILRDGVATTTNALKLLELVGLGE